MLREIISFGARVLLFGAVRLLLMLVASLSLALSFRLSSAALFRFAPSIRIAHCAVAAAAAVICYY